MNIRKVALTVLVLISVALGVVLISNYASERKRHSIDLLASREKEAAQQSIKALEVISDKPALTGEQKAEEKQSPTEDATSYKPVAEMEQKGEVQYYDSSTSDIAFDEELEKAKKEGPRSKKIAATLPRFKPTSSDTGPVADNEAVVQAAADDSEFFQALPGAGESYDYDGPSVPAGRKIEPLPIFTPIINQTGPVPIENE